VPNLYLLFQQTLAQMLEDKPEITILIAGIGGPTSRGIAKSLKKFSSYGPYRIIGIDANPFALGLYDRSYIDAAYIVPFVTSSQYWQAIQDIVKLESINIAIVQPEIEVEAWAVRAQDHQLPCAVLLPPIELIRSVRDKAKMFELLAETDLIPKSIRANRTHLSQGLASIFDFPCWIRASEGAGARGALQIKNQEEVDAWLIVQPDIEEFTVSHFLPGRNLACKMLYWKGELIRSACAERVEYFRAEVVPSKVSGLTSVGRLVNDKTAFDVSSQCVADLCTRLNVIPHGFFTVDLKEDSEGTPKVTEINVRHVSFTGAFAEVGVNLAEDMVQLLLGYGDRIHEKGLHYFDESWFFLRHIDSEMVVIKEKSLFSAVW
jgi:hypothetical protein